MAVYTQLTQDELNYLAAEFQLGDVWRVEWVPAGSINTNAILETSVNRFFCRYTTVRSEADLEFECALLETLHRHRVPAAHMLRVKGRASLPLREGRVCVFSFLEGSELRREELTPNHLFVLGQQLARCHLSLQDVALSRENPYGPAVVKAWLESLTENDDPTVALVAKELKTDWFEAQAGLPKKLPSGIIHGDLFLDNVKWADPGGPFLFDFEMACNGNWVLDLAITLNAWCFERDYKPELCSGLWSGYQSVRPMTSEEKLALWPSLRMGAIRFTASRIRDFHLSTLPADKLTKKDYRTYLARVRALRAAPSFALGN